MWAYRGEAEGGAVTDAYDVGTELPGGLRAFDARWATEAVLWSAEHRALLTGDVILGAARRAAAASRLVGARGHDARRRRRARSRRCSSCPVELVLPAHGEPVLADGAAALERALRV